MFEGAQDFHSKSLHEPLWWGFHVFIQIRGKVSAQSLASEVFKEHITDIFSMAENERCIIQPLLTDVVGSNLLKYFKSFFCLRQNLCLSELLLENWNSSACFSSLTGRIVFYSPAWYYRNFNCDELSRHSDYVLNICNQKGYCEKKPPCIPWVGYWGMLWTAVSVQRCWEWPCGGDSPRPDLPAAFTVHSPAGRGAFSGLDLEAPLWVRMYSLVFWICLFEYSGVNIFLKHPLYLSSMLKKGRRFLAM